MARQQQRLRASMAASWLYSRSTTDVSLCPDTKNHLSSAPGKICGEAAVTGSLKNKRNLRVRATSTGTRLGGALALAGVMLSLPAASALQAQTAEPAPPNV